MPQLIYTVGHSNRSIDDFLALLLSHSIETLVDVRTVPKSAYNPQFGGAELKKSLHQAGIQYRHSAGLGGLRKPKRDSPNSGWRNKSFQGYADHMQSPEFKDALKELIELSKSSQVVIMCAEAVPWRCHRNLIADALVAGGHRVEHIMGVAQRSPHKITPWAEVSGSEIIYPPQQASLFA